MNGPVLHFSLSLSGRVLVCPSATESISPSVKNPANGMIKHNAAPPIPRTYIRHSCRLDVSMRESRKIGDDKYFTLYSTPA